MNKGLKKKEFFVQKRRTIATTGENEQKTYNRRCSN